MNEKEDYFRISKNGDVHTLSDRIPFKWQEFMIWSFASFFILLYFVGLLVGLFVATLTLIGYIFYRFASWIFYSEVQINEKTGQIIKIKKLLNSKQKINVITNTYDINQFEFSEISRSGKTKFLLSYRTHKSHDLLILKNEYDKNIIKEYFKIIQ